MMIFQIIMRPHLSLYVQYLLNYLRIFLLVTLY